MLFNVAEESASEFLAWYRARHLPDLLASGFLSAHCYEAAAGPRRYLTVYEQDHDVVASAAYAATRASDENLAARESSVLALQKATYRQEWWSGFPGPAPLAGGDWMSLAGFEVDDERRPALLSDLRRRAQGPELQAGARLRLLSRLGGHPLFPEAVGPAVILMAEAAGPRQSLDGFTGAGFAFNGRRYHNLGR